MDDVKSMRPVQVRSGHKISVSGTRVLNVCSSWDGSGRNGVRAVLSNLIS